jgi:23S rRNA pseudouridine1911/1915/1917 synthase
MKILYSDRDIAVCIKPTGMDSEKQVPEALKEQLGGEIYTLHRLDLNVGGVMVYARTKHVAAQLSRAIQDGSMIKEYVAIVHGTAPESGDWEDLLWKDSRQNKVFVVKRQRAGVKKARLEYKVLRPGPESLVRVRLHTGRSHQIRVQFSSRNMALWGDQRYNKNAKPGQQIALWATKLTLIHPTTKEVMTFTSSLPDRLPFTTFRR